MSLTPTVKAVSMSGVQRVDATSAEDRSIGFDYQYYYFLNELINLKTGMTVGLEVMDDVHTELDNDIQVLIQLKHTIQSKADGNPKNLTAMDIDLWKSLSNWSKVITDEVSERAEVHKQISFVNKTFFLLTSNKSDNESNEFLNSVRNYQAKTMPLKKLILEITQMLEQTRSDKIKTFIRDVLSLDLEVSTIFFNHLQFDLGCDDIIAKCKISISEHHIADNRIDDVFRALDSDVRSYNFALVKAKKKIIVSFNDFRIRNRMHFDKARNEKLVSRQFTGLLPDNMIEQTFIKQLIDINDFKSDDITEITRLTIQLLTMRNNTDRWIKDSDITTEELDKLEAELISQWRNKFKAAYRGKITEEKIQEIALNVIDSLRAQATQIQNQNLGIEFSNGALYDLSDRPEIGWRNDWERKYK